VPLGRVGKVTRCHFRESQGNLSEGKCWRRPIENPLKKERRSEGRKGAPEKEESRGGVLLFAQGQKRKKSKGAQRRVAATVSCFTNKKVHMGRTMEEKGTGVLRVICGEGERRGSVRGLITRSRMCILDDFITLSEKGATGKGWCLPCAGEHAQRTGEEGGGNSQSTLGFVRPAGLSNIIRNNPRGDNDEVPPQQTSVREKTSRRKS